MGAGVFLTASLAFPGFPLVARILMDEFEQVKKEKEFKQWKRFNLGYLRQILKRLKQQKIVKEDIQNGQPVVILTEKGKTRYLKYQLQNMILDKPPKWDGRWRLIIYDIAKYKKKVQEVFRETLKSMKFLKLQNSVYLTPYPCGDEIEFLRQFYGIGDEVLILTVSSLENESAYKEYFNL